MREIVEIPLAHLTCFMRDRNPKLQGTASIESHFGKTEAARTFLQVAVVLSGGLSDLCQWQAKGLM